jgi:hypothetical protein
MWIGFDEFKVTSYANYSVPNFSVKHSLNMRLLVISLVKAVICLPELELQAEFCMWT